MFYIRRVIRLIDSCEHPFTHHCVVTTGLALAAMHEVYMGNLTAAIGFLSNLIWIWR